MKKGTKFSISWCGDCAIKRLYRKFMPQSISIQKKIFLLCTLVMLISTVTLSSLFLYITIHKIRQESISQIDIALDFVINDINRKISGLSQNLENLVFYEKSLQDIMAYYNNDSSLIKSPFFIYHNILPVCRELRKFAKGNRISTIRLYTHDKRLLFYYSAVVPKKTVTGLHIKTITGNDTFVDPDLFPITNEISDDFHIPYYPAPNAITPYFKSTIPTKRESGLFIKNNNVIIRVIEPFSLFKGENGFIIAEYLISDVDTSLYKRFTRTDINFFTSDSLSCGTLKNAPIPLNDKAYDKIINTESGLSRSAEKFQLSEVRINKKKYYQGHIRFYLNKTNFGTITASLKKHTELMEIVTTVILVVVSAMTVMLITFGLSVFFTKPYLQFIHNMINSVSAVAAGNLDQNIPTHTRDELGILAVSFKDMKDSIQQIISEQKRLVTILETTSDMICMYRSESEIMYMNSSLKRVLSNTDITRFNLYNLYPEWARDLLEHEGYFEAIKTGIWAGESAIIDESGVETPVSQVIVCHKNNDSVIEYFSTIMRDISDRKKNENLIKQNEENLSITLNSIGDAVIVTDNNGFLVRMNPIAEELTGWGNSETTGKPLDDIFKIVNYLDKTPLPNPVLQVIQNKQIINLQPNALLISKDNSEYRISDSAAPIIRDDGSLFGVVLVFRDETEKIKKDMQLIQSQKMEAVGTLAGGLAHDFNNVLGGIIGTASLLKEQLSNNDTIDKTKLLDHISLIEQSGEQAADIVRQLLTISHNQEFTFETVDLNQSVKSVSEMAKNTFDRSISIKTTYLDKPALINADPNQIEQVLLNLFINASHAMTIMRPDGDIWGGTLSVDIREISTNDLSGNRIKKIRLDVQDSGTGIRKADLKKIFTPFFSTKGKGKGSGLGLSMVYSIIEKHGGEISVYSEINRGTTFTLLFPLIESKTADNKKVPKKNIIERGSGLILVIDDEEILRKTSKAMLEECGYEVLTAKSGNEGIALYKENHDRISGIILDMIMPGLSGKETYQKLKEINPDVKVILASGFKQDERIESAMKMGIRDFIQKPYSLSELSLKAKKLLNPEKHNR
ncbi:MAG: response regulator [Spirochaetes bacterium]|nr:response regulator [Spirochaetota bacterium]